MSQNITLLGASYSDVPAVTLPKTGGGTARFTDVTDTTATTADVAQGKYFYLATGERVAGTASGGGGDDTDFANTIMRSGTVTHIPDSVTVIGDHAFSNCKNLAFTELPSGVTNIDNYAFYQCTNLALTELPSGVTSIGTNAFYQCTDLALTELPSGVTSIGAYAFTRCVSLTSVSCSGNIGTLAAGAFNGNSTYKMNLAHASFPNMTLRTIGAVFGSSSAAYACHLLEDADIGSTQGVATYAFANCYALQTLVLRKSDSICTLTSENAFTNTPMRGYNGLTGTIYVPQALISTYQTATNWSTLYNAGHLTFAAIEGSEYERD